jgi:hypothetical protein
MTLRYSDVRQKSSHNAFYQDEGIYDQFFYWRIHSLEFDINRTPQGALPDDPGAQVENEWFVYEQPHRTNVNRLSDAFSVLRGIHLTEPQHEVVTVFLDLKSPLEGAGHGPERLDALVEAFGESLAKPGEDTVVYRASAHPPYGEWPSLDDLRGKFLFALTGNEYLPAFQQYQNDRGPGEGFSIFLAPELETIGDMPSSSAFVDAFRTQWKDAVFANINFFKWQNNSALRGVPPELARAGIISRAFPQTILAPVVDGLNNAAEWSLAKAAGFHHIATNRINSLVDPFSRTNAENGWPFEALSGSLEPPPVQGRECVGVRVRSQDIFGGEDSCGISYGEFARADANRSLVCYIASPNSHVEAWAKGALMARASLESNADYFALVRPADDHPFQVQWRKGGHYKEVSLEERDDFAKEGFRIKSDTLVFGRLDISGNGFRARAFAALEWAGDDTRWVLIDDQVFDVPLGFQGVAASAHGGNTIVFQFGELGSEAGTRVLTLVAVGSDVSDLGVRLNSYPA